MKNQGALSDITVIDLSRLLPGPYCSMILADHGARVIAIESFTAVETLDYQTAHILSAALLGFSFLVLLFVYVMNGRGVRTHG